MKKISRFLIALAVIFSLIVPGYKANAAETVFTDVPDNYEHAEEIYEFVNKGIIQGYENGAFGMHDNITRGQAAIMLARLLELDLPSSEDVTKHFKDVQATANSASAIVAVKNEGIMEGANGKFNPYKELTREQMASIIVRALQLQQGDHNVEINLSNVSDAHRQSVQTIANLQITDQLNNYNPAKNITRVQFVLMLSRAMQNEDNQHLSELLKEVYANEQKLQSYEIEAKMNLGMTLPQLEELPEANMVANMLENISIDMTGAYQKDPLRIEANVDMTMKLSPQVDTTISMPIIMDENKLWMKVPQIPGEELPEQIKNKFIEIDFAELNEMQGLPTPNIDAQLKFAEAVQDLFVDYFANDYYSEISLDEFNAPANAKHVVKFSLTNEDVEQFINTLMTAFLPDFFELMNDPEYVAAMGLTEEEISELRDELAKIDEYLDEVLSTINDIFHINTFEQYIVINDDYIVIQDILNLDFDVTLEGETIGIIMSVDQSKLNINEDVTINIPDKDDTISFEQLLEDLLGDISPV